MRYHLRTLLIVLAVGPAILAAAWLIGKPIVVSYLFQPEEDVWIDVGGPGTIIEFSTKCTFEETEVESDPDTRPDSP